MKAIRLTKIELATQRKKLILFKKYLPTLQMKKMLLQLEVNKAREEIDRLSEFYLHRKGESMHHAALLTHPAASELLEALKIESLQLHHEHIAGIEVPVLKAIDFKELSKMLMHLPPWMDDAVELFRKLKTAHHKVLIARKKKEVLESELRLVSIRVNLFEKRLIPEIEGNITKIRVFLGDQELQSVAQAKLSKRKIFEREKEREESV